MRRWFSLFAVLLVVLISVAAARAQSDLPAGEAVKIDGFRSAHFGMAETEVRKAIRTDFGGNEVVRTTNDAERTTALTVSNQALLPDTPPATISYILGARSAKLVQVNVIWGGEGGADAKGVVTTANVLTAYFLRQGAYAKDSVVSNRQLEDHSVLAFRGADSKGHMILLQLFPLIDVAAVKDSSKEKPIEVKKASLRLSYMENPTHPDIFQIGKGQF